MKKLLSIAALAMLAAGAAEANDSVGHLAAGGVVLGKSDGVEMRAEDLYVSANEIRVRYRFFNRTGEDIETLVAFPLPLLPAPSEDDNNAIPVRDAVNFLDFKTSADGKPVNIEADLRVLALGVDRTKLLQSLNVPLSPVGESATNAIRALPAERQQELLKLGLAREEEYDIGQGMQKYLHPNWSLQVTYHWRQVFPAGREIVIEHSYKPSVGASAGTVIGSPYADAADVTAEIEAYKKRYCMEPSFIETARNARKKAETAANGEGLQEERIEYVLTTGANWAGPIQDFRLVVDKGAPQNLVSFCASGVRKISPTEFEVRYKDYTPQRNLEVLILKPAP